MGRFYVGGYLERKCGLSHTFRCAKYAILLTFKNEEQQFLGEAAEVKIYETIWEADVDALKYSCYNKVKAKVVPVNITYEEVT